MTKENFVDKMAEECIKRIEWAVHPTEIKASELLDMLAERLFLMKQIKEQEE